MILPVTVFTLKRVFNLGANMNCMFLRKDGERHRVQEGANSPLSIDLFRQEVEIVFASRGFLPTTEQIKLRQRLVRERTQINNG